MTATTGRINEKRYHAYEKDRGEYEFLGFSDELPPEYAPLLGLPEDHLQEKAVLSYRFYEIPDHNAGPTDKARMARSGSSYNN